jgi:2-phosphoglycerate kinase
MANLPGVQVIFVGGAPLSGKTSLSKVLARRLEMAHVSTDDVSTAIRAVTSAESHPALHYLDVDGCFRDYYPAHTPERLLEDALAFHRAAWPAIEAVARAHAERNRPALIEGWGILPELVAGIGLESTKALFLIPEETVYEQRCRADVSFWEGAADEEGLIRSFARRSMLFARGLEASAREHGWPVLRTSQETSPEETVDLALGLLEAGGQKTS